MLAVSVLLLGALVVATSGLPTNSWDLMQSFVPYMSAKAQLGAVRAPGTKPRCFPAIGKEKKVCGAHDRLQENGIELLVDLLLRAGLPSAHAMFRQALTSFAAGIGRCLPGTRST